MIMDRKTLALLISSMSGDTYTKEEIDSMISQLKQFEMEVVDSLPSTNIKQNCLYFVPRGAPGLDAYYEYIYVNGKWEFVGSTEVDLTNYWTIDETMEYVEANKYVLPEATVDTLGGIKLSNDGAISLDADGNMNIATTSDEDIENLFSNISA